MKALACLILLLTVTLPVSAAPGTNKSRCQFGTVDRAFVRVYGGANLTTDGAIADAWLVALRPTTGGANFGGLPRVATVTLFRDDTFAGMLMVRGDGDRLRLWARDDEKAWNWQPCAVGELPVAVVYEWIEEQS